MDLASEVVDLIRRTADTFPWGPARRRYLAETVATLGLGQRQAYLLFGWGRDALRKALHERRTGITCQDATSCRGRKPIEFHLPRLLDDIQDLVADHVRADPTFRTTRLVCRLTGPGGPPPTRRPQGRHRRATAQLADHHHQAQRFGLSPGQSPPVPPQTKSPKRAPSSRN